ncbi:capsular polysaccharide export protein, LipB/KpsS family [Methanococcoides methylutens]|uniref:capsular polysaccharide export protein, LipB/KpsS family n=1 Tax=Methanococcoides methylutens TaxID=2226 RepID=UPI004043EAED
MKILIYMPFADWVPHFATHLEIAAKHMANGDEVHVIQCSGGLLSCEPNPNHYRYKCYLCKSRRDKGLDTIKLPNENRHEIDFEKHSLDMDIPQFVSLNELKQFTYDDTDIGMAVAASLISMVRDSDPDVGRYSAYVEKNILMSIAVYNSIKNHLELLDPDIFYMFNGRFAALRPALRAAQKSGVKTFVHERAGVLQKYSLAENNYPHDIDYQKTEIEKYWEEDSQLIDKDKISSNWYEKRMGGADQSWYSFTKSQKKGSLPEGFDTTKRNIAIYISSQDEFEAITGWKNDIYENQTEAVVDLANSDVDEDIVFYLRIHPNLKGLKNTQVRELYQITSPNLKIIPAESKIDSYNLLMACEKVITFGSTIGIEAVFWGKPSILIGRAFYEGVGSCYMPKNKKELLDLINGYLEPGDKIGALKFGYWQAIRGESYVYYKPESVRGGAFMGVYLKNPLVEKIKGRILSNDLLSRLIFNSAYMLRKTVWFVRGS